MRKQDLFNIIGKTTGTYLDGKDRIIEESKKHDELSDEAHTEDKCEACGGEIITRGNCGACLECDAQWGEPEYVECEWCGGEGIIDALGFFCLDCNYH